MTWGEEQGDRMHKKWGDKRVESARCEGAGRTLSNTATGRGGTMCFPCPAGFQSL